MAHSSAAQLFNAGRGKQAAGKIDEAEALFRDAVLADPRHAPSLHALGVLQLRRKDFAAAVRSFQQSIAANETVPDVYAAYAFALRSAGNLVGAITALQRAVELSPARFDLLMNLGNALGEDRQLEAAVTTYNAAIRMKPTHAPLFFNLGMAYRGLFRNADAITAFERAIALNGQYLTAYVQLGDTLTQVGRLQDGKRALQTALAIDPACAEAHGFMGIALAELGQRAEAIAAYRAASALDPAATLWPFRLAALTGSDAVDTMPASYIRACFDSYAPTFDSHLVDTLGYRSPQLLQAAVRAIETRSDLDVLDLGCGTGLAGVEFRAMAKRLVGVDLSPEMLKQAGKRNLYDKLIEADLATALSNQAGLWDLILAADVFVYVGDLRPVFEKAREALRPSGLFGFTVEQYDGEGVHLHDRFRFSHSMQYVEKLAREFGFERAIMETTPLRREGDARVPGIIFVLRR